MEPLASGCPWPSGLGGLLCRSSGIKVSFLEECRGLKKEDMQAASCHSCLLWPTTVSCPRWTSSPLAKMRGGGSVASEKPYSEATGLRQPGLTQSIIQAPSGQTL